jgi:hypothetical protein
MRIFTDQNTEGYTQEELDALNTEWAERATKMGLEEGADEYDFQAKTFADETARR